MKTEDRYSRSQSESPVWPVSRPLYAQCQLTALLKAVIVRVCWKTCLCVDRVMGKYDAFRGFVSLANVHYYITACVTL